MDTQKCSAGHVLPGVSCPSLVLSEGVSPDQFSAPAVWTLNGRPWMQLCDSVFCPVTSGKETVRVSCCGMLMSQLMSPCMTSVSHQIHLSQNTHEKASFRTPLSHLLPRAGGGGGLNSS